MKAIARVILIFMFSVAVAVMTIGLFMKPVTAGGVTVYSVVDRSNAIRVITKDGGKARNFMCLITPETHGYTGDPRWIGLTCAEMGVEPLIWKFCKGTPGKPILLCVTTDTIINGVVEDANPGDEFKIRMRMY